MYPQKGLERRIKRHVRAKEQLFFAICQPGFEEVMKDELVQLGIKSEINILEGGVEFLAKIDDCYHLHLASHCATRFIMRLFKFKVVYFEKLAGRISDFPWELYVKPEVPLVFNIKCRHSRLYHSGRIEIEFKKAILNYLKAKINYQPNQIVPAQTIFVRFKDDICSVSLDCSGEALYKRGIKQNICEAPLRETLAALILKAANFSSYKILVDPMCGSGTFSLEAALLNSRILPGVNRDFSFINWPVFSEPAFDYLKRELQKQKEKQKIKIYASDENKKAVEITKQNISRNGMESLIHLSRKDFFTLSNKDFSKGEKLIVLNPPYGKRIGNKKETIILYRKIGLKIRKDFSSCGYAVIVPGLETEKALGLGYDKKILFMNGGIKAALLIRFN